MMLERLVNLKRLKSYRFEAADGEIGRCADLHFEERRFTIRYLAVQERLWRPERILLLPPFTVGEIDENKKMLFIELTQQQIKRSPAISPNERVTRDIEERFFRYYKWPPYWNASPSSAEESSRETRLRTASEIRQFSIATVDGPLGRIEDLVIDTRYWVIRYLAIDTRDQHRNNRLLLFSPSWTPHMRWCKNDILVDFNRDMLRKAPHYDAGRPISRDYELQVCEHFGKQAYWN